MSVSKTQSQIFNLDDLLSKFKQHDKDVGSMEYQIIALTHRIKYLDEHCKIHKKDHPVHRRLYALVSKRKRFQKYLIENKYPRYGELIEALGLRK